MNMIFLTTNYKLNMLSEKNSKMFEIFNLIWYEYYTTFLFRALFCMKLKNIVVYNIGNIITFFQLLFILLCVWQQFINLSSG